MFDIDLDLLLKFLLLVAFIIVVQRLLHTRMYSATGGNDDHITIKTDTADKIMTAMNGAIGGAISGMTGQLFGGIGGQILGGALSSIAGGLVL